MNKKEYQNIWDNAVVYGYIMNYKMRYALDVFCQISGIGSYEAFVDLNLKRCLDIDLDGKRYLAHSSRVRDCILLHAKGVKRVEIVKLEASKKYADLFNAFINIGWKKRISKGGTDSRWRKRNAAKIIGKTESNKILVKKSEYDKRTDWNTVK